MLKDNLSKADAEVHELDKIVDQVREVSGEKLLMKSWGKSSLPSSSFCRFCTATFLM